TDVRTTPGVGRVIRARATPARATPTYADTDVPRRKASRAGLPLRGSEAAVAVAGAAVVVGVRIAGACALRDAAGPRGGRGSRRGRCRDRGDRVGGCIAARAR